MRVRLGVLAVVLLVAAIQLSRESGSAVAPLPRELETRRAAPPVPLNAPPPPPRAPLRDPFRFANELAPVRPSQGRSDSVASSPAPEPTPAPARVRLVGFVRRAGELRALLVVDGEVVLASAGDTVGGFRVLSLDESQGVRISDPEGLETALALPEEP